MELSKILEKRKPFREAMQKRDRFIAEDRKRDLEDKMSGKTQREIEETHKNHGFFCISEKVPL